MLSYLGHLALLVLLCCAPPINGSWSQSEPTPDTKEISSTPEGSQFNPELQALLERLEGIESVIRDLNTETDPPNENPQNEIEERGLVAQERMAYSSVGMLITSIITIFLILITLHYTRKAAQHTKHMLDQAEETTRAAKETIEVTKIVSEKQIQAYISISNPIMHLLPSPSISLDIKNVGQSPAIDITLKFKRFDFTFFKEANFKGEGLPNMEDLMTHRGITEPNSMNKWNDLENGNSTNIIFNIFSGTTEGQEKKEEISRLCNLYRFSVMASALLEWNNVFEKKCYMPVCMFFGEFDEVNHNHIHSVQPGNPLIEGRINPMPNKEQGRIMVIERSKEIYEGKWPKEMED